MILNSDLNLSSVKVIPKILSFSSVKKKKATDRPNPKAMGGMTANKIFTKDGPNKIYVEIVATGFWSFIRILYVLKC